MKHYLLLIPFFAAILTSCTHEVKEKEEEGPKEPLIVAGQPIQVIACDGCCDSVIYVIPTADLDIPPVKFNIVAASQKNKIIGKLEVGDWCSVIVNEKDTTVADMVINMDLLKGAWVQKVYPRVKPHAKESFLEQYPNANFDSVLVKYMIPVEMGFQLKRQHVVSPLGSFNVNRQKSSPVMYPIGRFYTEWYVERGKLILKEGTFEVPGVKKSASTQPKRKIVSDTCDIVFLLKDSLQLKFKDRIENYYRQKNQK